MKTRNASRDVKISSSSSGCLLHVGIWKEILNMTLCKPILLDIQTPVPSLNARTRCVILTSWRETTRIIDVIEYLNKILILIGGCSSIGRCPFPMPFPPCEHTLNSPRLRKGVNQHHKLAREKRTIFSGRMMFCGSSNLLIVQASLQKPIFRHNHGANQNLPLFRLLFCLRFCRRSSSSSSNSLERKESKETARKYRPLMIRPHRYRFPLRPPSNVADRGRKVGI